MSAGRLQVCANDLIMARSRDEVNEIARSDCAYTSVLFCVCDWVRIDAICISRRPRSIGTHSTSLFSA